VARRRWVCEPGGAGQAARRFFDGA